MTRSLPQRRLWVIRGALEQALQQLDTAASLPSDTLWIGRQAPAGVQALAPGRVVECLGSERRLLVFDAHEGLQPDALAAAVGTLCAGGLLLLLLPDWSHASEQDCSAARFAPYPYDCCALRGDFAHRIQNFLRNVQPSAQGRSGADWPSFFTVEQILPALALPAVRQPEIHLNAEQQQLVEAVLKVALGHARRPLVLLADRGRGKSTALGAALARLLRTQPRRILLLGPHPDAVEAVFAQLQRELPEGHLQQNRFELVTEAGSGEVLFRLPYEQLEQPEPCQLLVIDEAATVPMEQLERLLLQHNRVVFSSTVLGYEGSGRGFELRFLRLLESRFRQWHLSRLDHPVRWALGDPLETWLNRALLLNVELPVLPPRLASVQGAAVRCERIALSELASDESLLRQVFGLLVNAHYQTRPSDLQQLLEAPGLQLLLAVQQGVVLGCALVVEEGCLPQDLLSAVALGQRRLRGHMLVQSLALHAALPQLPGLTLWRVMRIAVRVELRRRGIGQALLAELKRQASTEQCDLLGCAFAVDAASLGFWRTSGFVPVRLGQRLDRASGTYSLQMLQAISAQGDTQVSAAVSRFATDWPMRLQAEFRQLDIRLAVELLVFPRSAHALGEGYWPDPADRQQIQAFAAGNMGLQDALPALHRVLLGMLRGGQLQAGPDLQAPPMRVLLRCVLQSQALPAQIQDRAEPPLQVLRELVKKVCTKVDRSSRLSLHSRSSKAIGEASMLSVGDKAPDFVLPDADMTMTQSADLAGTPYVLYFYPKDDTPGCTLEAQEFTDLEDDFAELNTAVFGVSKDTCVSHGKFRDKYGLSVRLLADVEGSLCADYGVWQEKDKNGEKKMGIVRSTFVIDAEGVIRYANYKVSPKGHADQILEFVKTL